MNRIVEFVEISIKCSDRINTEFGSNLVKELTGLITWIWFRSSN